MQGVQRGFHFIPLLPNPGRIYVLHQCSPTEQFHAILPHKPIPVLTGSSMRDNGIFFTSGGNSPPTGHHLDTVWALLKIFEDICMFEFVELHCLMLFMFVHLAGTVESSSNNPIPNCEAEGLLHLLILAPSCCPNRCGRSTSAVTSPQVTACHRTAEFGQKIPRRSQHIPATAATYLGSLPNLSKVATAQRLVKL